MSIWLILLLVLALLWIAQMVVKRVLTRKSPYKPLPGPYGVPLLGYLPFVGTQPYKTFYQLKPKYGDVFQVNIASLNIVVLNSPEVIREALSKVICDYSIVFVKLLFKVMCVKFD